MRRSLVILFCLCCVTLSVLADGMHYFLLAEDYRLGQNGQQQNLAKALQYYKKAARYDNLAAIHNIGVHYELGHGVKPSTTKALQYYFKAAQQDYAPSQYKLSCFYAQGYGVEVDTLESIQWLRLAAQQGLPEAQYDLANYYTME